ncbi:MAG: polymer-forming cytoskeletal protein [Polyangiales bacterium]
MTARGHRALGSLLLVATLGFTSLPALAELRREGDWPDDTQEHVTLSFAGPRSEAIRKLAAAVDWSIVGVTVNEDSVDVQVKDQPAGKVLALLLEGGKYVAKRDGKLLAIAPDQAQPKAAAPTAQQPSAAATPAPTAPPAHAEDRTVFGRGVEIGPKEAVANLTVFGGSADIRGIVTKDVTVFGGSVDVHPGAHIYGDLSLMGGSANIRDGAQVDGDVTSAGGHIERGDAAAVSGDITQLDKRGIHEQQTRGSDGDWDDDHDEDKDDKDDESDEGEGSFIGAVGSAISQAALLFAFGSILLALAGSRMETFHLEAAQRPMRALGFGAATLFGGTLALIALCITLIGIPVAIVVLIAGLIGMYAGMCAVFTLLGALVLHNRVVSPYAHLGLGCALYLVISSLPVIGWVATTAAALIGLGLLVTTRGAGFFGPRDDEPSAGALQA